MNTSEASNGDIEAQRKEQLGLQKRAEKLTVESALTADRIEAIAQQEANDRSMITREVMQQFGIAVLAVFALLALSGFMSKDWSKTADQSVDVIKSVILPIVTLVLGYYFGKSAK